MPAAHRTERTQHLEQGSLCLPIFLRHFAREFLPFLSFSSSTTDFFAFITLRAQPGPFLTPFGAAQGNTKSPGHKTLLGNCTEFVIPKAFPYSCNAPAAAAATQQQTQDKPWLQLGLEMVQEETQKSPHKHQGGSVFKTFFIF